MNSIDVIDECVADKEEYTMTVGVYENNQPRFIVFGGGGAIVAPIEHDYELCGVTKVFTAALIQKLIAQDKMSLQSPLSAFLPDIEKEKDFTAYQLLSGETKLSLPFALKAKHYAAMLKPQPNSLLCADRPSLLEILKACKLKDNSFSGDIEYALLGEMAASAANESFDAQLNTLILNDMHLTGFRFTNGTGTLKEHYSTVTNNTFSAAHGLAANVTACLRFLKGALCQELSFNLNLSDTENLLTAHGLKGCETGTGPNAELSGLNAEKNIQIIPGWISSSDGLVWQSGANSVFSSFFGLDFKNKRAVCVLSNTVAHAHKGAAEAGLLYLREKRAGRELVFM